MLDILHISNTAVIRNLRAWNGRGRFLAGWLGIEIIDGKNQDVQPAIRKNNK
jgi:hypothetical protein